MGTVVDSERPQDVGTVGTGLHVLIDSVTRQSPGGLYIYQISTSVYARIRLMSDII
jgi:hypothetical protein